MAFFVTVKQLRNIIREELGYGQVAEATPEQASPAAGGSVSLDKDTAFVKRLLMDINRAMRVVQDYSQFRDIINQIITGATGAAAATTTTTQDDKDLGLANIESDDPLFNQIKTVLVPLMGKLPEPTPQLAAKGGVDVSEVYVELEKAKKLIEKYVKTSLKSNVHKPNVKKTVVNKSGQVTGLNRGQATD